MTALILGGGRSGRLGRDKISLVVAGESLLQRTINRLNQLDNPIILVLAKRQKAPIEESSPSIRIATDLRPGKGPLVGIYSGLVASEDDYCLAVACDMPFLNVELLRYMIEISPGFDIVIPRIEGRVHPLHAIYSRNCLGPMEDMLEQDDLKLRNLLARVKVRFVEEDEVDRFDPDHLSFFNINWPDDLQKAEQMIVGQKPNSNVQFPNTLS